MTFKPVHALVHFYNRRHNPLIIDWLRRRYDCRVSCVVIDLGEIREFSKIELEALRAGADTVHYVDARDEFAETFIAKAIKANGVYQGKYYLSSALARPMLAMKLVEMCRENEADTVIHGFRGNDQIRLDMAISTLSSLRVSAALRDWDVSEEEICNYAEKNGIADEFGTNNPYSVSENIWGKSTECGPLGEPEQEPPEEVYRYVTPPSHAPDRSEVVTLEFESGCPVGLNSRKLTLLEIIMELNEIGARHGVGITDMVEDGVVGIKTRAVYESPAATCLIEAHRELERFVCNRHENSFKSWVDEHWSYLTYAGLWYDRLMEHLNGFNDSINKIVDGVVKLRLYKGTVAAVGRESANSIYDESMAVYNFGHLFSSGDAEGFGRVLNLHTKMAFAKRRLPHEN